MNALPFLSRAQFDKLVVAGHTSLVLVTTPGTLESISLKAAVVVGLRQSRRAGRKYHAFELDSTKDRWIGRQLPVECYAPCLLFLGHHCLTAVRGVERALFLGWLLTAGEYGPSFYSLAEHVK